MAVACGAGRCGWEPHARNAPPRPTAADGRAGLSHRASSAGQAAAIIPSPQQPRAVSSARPPTADARPPALAAAPDRPAGLVRHPGPGPGAGPPHRPAAPHRLDRARRRTHRDLGHRPDGGRLSLAGHGRRALPLRRSVVRAGGPLSPRRRPGAVAEHRLADRGPGRRLVDRLPPGRGDAAGGRRRGRRPLVRLEQGLPVGTVFDVQPDRQGQVWAGTSRGLFLLRGDRWVLQGRPRAWTSVSWTAGPGPRRHAVGERAGRRWYVRARGRPLPARPGAGRHEAPAPPGRCRALAVGCAGPPAAPGGRRPRLGPGHGQWRSAGGPGRRVWISTNQGLLRAVPPGPASRWGIAALRPGRWSQRRPRAVRLRGPRRHPLVRHRQRPGPLPPGAGGGRAAAPGPRHRRPGALPDGTLLVGSVGQPPAL
jgi:hypothetical protein